MHPIILLLIGGTGAYFLYGAMEDEEPEVQALPNKNGDTVVVPTRSHHKHPRTSLTEVPHCRTTGLRLSTSLRPTSLVQASIRRLPSL